MIPAAVSMAATTAISKHEPGDSHPRKNTGTMVRFAARDACRVGKSTLLATQHRILGGVTRMGYRLFKYAPVQVRLEQVVRVGALLEGLEAHDGLFARKRRAVSGEVSLFLAK